MNYLEAYEYIQSLTCRGIMPGLEVMSVLCDALGNPQKNLKIIHIAGTNGKGSVGAFISNIFMCAGFSVGRYVSPAVENPREIIQFNGSYISESEYAECTDIVKRACEKISALGMFPTSFEFETAMAFVFFYKKKCSYCVIECGLGGLLDATNIINTPEAAVITSIGMDHSVYLGNNISEIALNKSGIIKENGLVFSAHQKKEAANVISKICSEKQADLSICSKPEILISDISKTCFNYKDFKDLEIKLCGAFQPDNAVLALECCTKLGIDERFIRTGLKNTVWRYRFEITENNPYWIYDGAHNPDAAYSLRRSLDEYFPNKRLIFIIGVFKDKDYDTILSITAPYAYKIFTVTPASKRGLDSAILADKARKYCNNVIDAKNTHTAAALCSQEICDAVIIFGSLSFLKNIKKERSNGKMQKNI